MAPYHGDTFKLLGRQPQPAAESLDALAQAERRLGMRLPAWAREWYSSRETLSILAEHGNDDPPVSVSNFDAEESPFGRLLPIRRENHGVCAWAVCLDGSEDPPVYVDVDSSGNNWQLLKLYFYEYVHTTDWDYTVLLGRPALVQARSARSPGKS